MHEIFHNFSMNVNWSKNVDFGNGLQGLDGLDHNAMLISPEERDRLIDLCSKWFKGEKTICLTKFI